MYNRNKDRVMIIKKETDSLFLLIQEVLATENQCDRSVD